MSEQKKDAGTEKDTAAAEITPAEEASPPTKKAAKPKKRVSHAVDRPSCIDMITEAVNNLGEKNGSSYQAIKKYIGTNFGCDMDNKLVCYVRRALKKGVANGTLIQTSGQGESGAFRASGCFKMGAASQTLMSKPTKRQIASAEAAAKEATKAQQAAKRAAKAAKRPKKKKHVAVVQKAAAKPKSKRPAVKKSAKKPAAKKAVKRGGRKGRK